MRKSLIVFVFLILSAGLAVTACSTAEKPQSAEAALKIGSLTIEENLPILVSLQNGYFTEQKVEVELVTFQSPVESQSAFQSGELDGMITDLQIAAMLKSAGQNLKVTSLALGATPEEGRFAIIASPQSKIQSLADLRGKSIGISSNSVIEYVTDGLLLSAGIQPSEVNKVVIPKIPLRLEMLLSNQIDAITVPDPHISYTVSKGAKIVTDDSRGDNLSQSVIVITDQALRDKQESLKRFYQAYSRAVDEINRSPDKYKDLLVKNINVPAEIAANYRVQHYSRPQLPGEQEVSRILTWLQQKNLLKNEITYEDLTYQGLY